MSRIKLSEYRSKKLIYGALQQSYNGYEVHALTYDIEDVLSYMKRNKAERYVLKVDQAVKKRNKLGLVNISVTKENIRKCIKKYADLGYQWLLIEPFYAHKQSDEKYLSLELTRNGVIITYSDNGGVDIEEHKESLITYDESQISNVNTVIDPKYLRILCDMFNDQHMTHLELNPLVIDKQKPIALDAAVLVDDSALFLVEEWGAQDARRPNKHINEYEKEVEKVALKSQASLNLKVINENGSLFLLLSGGGASVVVFDECVIHGGLDMVGNYGEYSGNPSEHETYLYATQIIKLMLKSNAPKKTLLIAGGVANFTDVKKTFLGIISALRDNVNAIKRQHISVIVRRGGPNQEDGLRYMKDFLDSEGIYNEVFDTSESLSSAVRTAIMKVRG